MGSGGGKPKAQQPTAEEVALQRAQIVALSNQDNELSARKKRIVRGQLAGGRASILKSGIGFGGGGGATGGVKSNAPGFSPAKPSTKPGAPRRGH